MSNLFRLDWFIIYDHICLTVQRYQGNNPLWTLFGLLWWPDWKLLSLCNTVSQAPFTKTTSGEKNTVYIYNMIAIFPGVEDVRHHPWHCVVASKLYVLLDDRKIHLKLLFATSPRINRRTKWLCQMVQANYLVDEYKSSISASSNYIQFRRASRKTLFFSIQSPRIYTLED